MFQINAHDEKRSKFYLLYEAAIQHGQVQLPPLSKSQALSMRSQLNRFRLSKRGEEGTQYWDLVSNKLIKLTDNTWTIRMVYEKAFWDAIGETLGLPPRSQEEVIVSAQSTPNITDLLSDTFGVQ